MCSQGTLQMRGPARAKRLFELHCDVARASRVIQALARRQERIRKDLQRDFRGMGEDMEELKRVLHVATGGRSSAHPAWPRPPSEPSSLPASSPRADAFGVESDTWPAARTPIVVAARRERSWRWATARSLA